MDNWNCSNSYIYKWCGFIHVVLTYFILIIIIYFYLSKLLFILYLQCQALFVFQTIWKLLPPIFFYLTVMPFHKEDQNTFANLIICLKTNKIRLLLKVHLMVSSSLYWVFFRLHYKICRYFPKLNRYSFL